MRGKQLLYRGILVVLLCGVALMYTQSKNVLTNVEKAVAASIASGPQVGQEAPAFELMTLQGEGVSLEQYKGKKVILNFFASWCSPCQEEMPLVEQLHKRLQIEDGVMLAVNLTSEEGGEKGSNLKQFLLQYGSTFDPLLDKEGTVMKKYQIIGIPTTIMIDEQGMVTKRINGQLTNGIMEELLAE